MDPFDNTPAVDPALVAEIDSVEPAYPVPDSAGRLTAEALEVLMHMLDLQEVHELLWAGYANGVFNDEQGALWAERAAEVLAAWLRDHEIRQVAFWFPSKITQHWVRFKLSAAK